MTDRYPVARTMLEALDISTERVQVVSYWANAQTGEEGGNVTLNEDAIRQATTPLNRHPARDVVYRASPISHCCRTCSAWQHDQDDKGVCAALMTTAPLAGGVLTPGDLYCTAFVAKDPSKHGGYMPAPLEDETEQDETVDRD